MATTDAIQLLTAELAQIGRTPTPAEVDVTMRLGFRPARFLILADGRGVRLSVNRLAARVAARSAGMRFPAAVIEVEDTGTGERVRADVRGRFAHRDTYRQAPAVGE